VNQPKPAQPAISLLGPAPLLSSWPTPAAQLTPARAGLRSSAPSARTARAPARRPHLPASPSAGSAARSLCAADSTSRLVSQRARPARARPSVTPRSSPSRSGPVSFAAQAARAVLPAATDPTTPPCQSCLPPSARPQRPRRDHSRDLWRLPAINHLRNPRHIAFKRGCAISVPQHPQRHPQLPTLAPRRAVARSRGQRRRIPGAPWRLHHREPQEELSPESTSFPEHAASDLGPAAPWKSSAV